MQTLRQLSPDVLQATMDLTASCFPTDVGFRWALPLAAGTEARDALAQAAGIDLAHQWVVTTVNGHTAVAGTFGLYRPTCAATQENGLLLLNWFCVAPDHRGRGLGRQLWDQMLTEATRLGAQRLIFYSSTEPHHISADRLYLAAGCARRMGSLLPDGQHRLTYFDRALGPAVPPADARTATRIDAVLERQFALDADTMLIALATSDQRSSAAAIAA